MATHSLRCFARAQAVMMLKKVSIANLGFALASAPLLHYITSASGQGANPNPNPNSNPNPNPNQTLTLT